MDSGERTDGPALRDSRLMFLPIGTDDEALFYVWGA